MFPFTFWKKSEPAGPLAVKDAVFTREDMFVLLGGFDLASFAVHQGYIDLDFWERKGSGPWRERLVARFGPRGLVDSAGRPCPELEEALLPLAPSGRFVSDGDEPREPGEREARSAVLYVDPGWCRCTMVTRSGRGFKLEALGPDREVWEERFLTVFGLKGIWRPARAGQHYIEGNFDIRDVQLSSAVKGGPSAVREYCAKRGIESPMLEDVAALPWYNRPNLIQFISGDLTKGIFPSDLGFFYPATVAGEMRTKGAVIMPEVGLSLYWGVSPREGMPMFGDDDGENIDKSRYTGFDFIGPETGLMEYMLTFYDYPE